MPAPVTTLLFEHPSRKGAHAPLRRFLRDVAARVAGGRAVICLITDDQRLRALNRQFRGQDYPTDVLSFPESGAGELAISLDTAERQACALGHSVEDELRILILHGLLHLAGMDHETDSGAMARAEARWRRELGLPAGLIERSRPPRRKKATA